jgi:hypothetical protein
MTRSLRLLPALAALALAAPATADPDPAAEQLFRDGKQLMKEGRIAEACATFEASEAAEHNVATVMNLADCREKDQQLASAWALYLRVDGECRADPVLVKLGETARDRAAALEPHLSALVINVPEDSSVHGLVVTRDGVALEEGAWNRAIPLDGGEHVITARAPGHRVWTTTVRLAVRDDHAAVEVPRFSELPLLTPPAITTPPSVTPVRPRATPGLVREAPPSSARAWSIGLVAGGAATLAVAGGVWWKARDLHLDGVAACPPLTCGPSDAMLANKDETSAKYWARSGNVIAVVGATAITAGAVVWLWHGHEARSLALVPAVGDGAGVAVTGGF